MSTTLAPTDRIHARINVWRPTLREDGQLSPHRPGRNIAHVIVDMRHLPDWDVLFFANLSGELGDRLRADCTPEAEAERGFARSYYFPLLGDPHGGEFLAQAARAASRDTAVLELLPPNVVVGGFAHGRETAAQVMNALRIYEKWRKFVWFDPLGESANILSALEAGRADVIIASGTVEGSTHLRVMTETRLEFMRQQCDRTGKLFLGYTVRNANRFVWETNE